MGRRCDDGVRVCEENRRAQALEADRIAEDAGPDILMAGEIRPAE